MKSDISGIRMRNYSSSRSPSKKSKGARDLSELKRKNSSSSHHQHRHTHSKSKNRNHSHHHRKKRHKHDYYRSSSSRCSSSHSSSLPSTSHDYHNKQSSSLSKLHNPCLSNIPEIIPLKLTEKQELEPRTHHSYPPLKYLPSSDLPSTAESSSYSKHTLDTPNRVSQIVNLTPTNSIATNKKNNYNSLNLEKTNLDERIYNADLKDTTSQLCTSQASTLSSAPCLTSNPISSQCYSQKSVSHNFLLPDKSTLNSFNSTPSSILSSPSINNSISSSTLANSETLDSFSSYSSSVIPNTISSKFPPLSQDGSLKTSIGTSFDSLSQDDYKEKDSKMPISDETLKIKVGQKFPNSDTRLEVNPNQQNHSDRDSSIKCYPISRDLELGLTQHSNHEDKNTRSSSSMNKDTFQGFSQSNKHNTNSGTKLIKSGNSNSQQEAQDQKVKSDIISKEKSNTNCKMSLLNNDIHQKHDERHHKRDIGHNKKDDIIHKKDEKRQKKLEKYSRSDEKAYEKSAKTHERDFELDNKKQLDDLSNQEVKFGYPDERSDPHFKCKEILNRNNDTSNQYDLHQNYKDKQVRRSICSDRKNSYPNKNIPLDSHLAQSNSITQFDNSNTESYSIPDNRNKQQITDDNKYSSSSNSSSNLSASTQKVITPPKSSKSSSLPTQPIDTQTHKLDKNKLDRLNRFQAFAAAKLAKPFIEPSSPSTESILPSLEASKSTNNKLGFKISAATPQQPSETLLNSNINLNLFTETDQTISTNGPFNNTQSSSSTDNTTQLEQAISSSSTSEFSESIDPLDSFMSNIEKTLLSQAKEQEISYTKTIHFPTPKDISLEEIQGWRLKKHKWDTTKLEHSLEAQNFSPDPNQKDINTLVNSNVFLPTSDPYDSIAVDPQLAHPLNSLASISGSTPSESKSKSDDSKTKTDGIISSKLTTYETHEEEDYHDKFIKEMKMSRLSQNKETINERKTPLISEETKISSNIFSEKEAQRLFSDEEDEPEQVNIEPSTTESYFDLVRKMGQKKELPPVDHSTIQYAPFRKNLYVQVKEISLMKDHEVEALRKTHGNIKVKGKNCPRPIKSFYQCGIPDKIAKIIQNRVYNNPFPIQMQAIPCIMAGRDTIAVAETGSGKTLAYLLPLIRHVLDQKPLKEGDGPIAMIIAPTRELAIQIYQEANKFCKQVDLRAVAVYGGTGVGEQLGQLRRGTELVIGTPGRLIDVLTISNGKVTNLKRVTFIVLDEADRMFDMGFEPQITAITKNIRPDRQTCLFSATFPPHIEGIARKILYKPIEIIVGERGRTASQIKQYVEVRTEQDKFYRLLQLLGEWYEHGSIVIFVNRQIEADDLFAELLKHGYTAAVLHGGQDQTDREFTIQDFKEGVYTLLVATSIAARGLDVKAVVLVINYKAPDHLEDYVHRIGRTGRAGNIGVSYTFITPLESDKAEDLIKALKQSDQEVSNELSELANLYRVKCNLGVSKLHKGKGFGGRGYKFNSNEKSRLQLEKQAAKKDLGMETAEDTNNLQEEDAFGLLTDDGYRNLDDSTTQQAKPKIPPPPSGMPPDHLLLNTSTATNTTSDQQLYLPYSSQSSPIHSTVLDAAARAKLLFELIKKSENTAKSEISEPITKPVHSQAELDFIKQAESIAKNLVINIQNPLERENQYQTIKSSILESLPKSNLSFAMDSTPTTSKSLSIADQTIEALKLGKSSLADISKGFGKIPGLPAIATKTPLFSGPQPFDPISGNYTDELSINEYPQQARFKVTHKEELARISEETGTVCQIKGQFVPPEQLKNMLPGVKPLYIEIVGSTPISIQRAKHALRGLMESISMKQLNSSNQQKIVGRYSVV